MGIFVVLLGVPLILQYAVFGQTRVNFEKKNKRALMFFFVMLTLLLMFRHEMIGEDTLHYIHLFERISFSDWSMLNTFDFENGFVYFCKIGQSTVQT